jgi:hypothetical protein
VKFQDLDHLEKHYNMAWIMQKLIKMAMIEEDYCTPPLAMERESVLDRYFENITVQLIVSEKEGLDRIAKIPGLWSK